MHLKENSIHFPVAVKGRHPSACIESGKLQLALGSVVVQSCRRPDRSNQRERERRKEEIHRQRQTHCGSRACVCSYHHQVQPATPVRKETKGRGRHKGASVTAGKVKERQGEGGEGRKEGKGGRKEAGA